MNRVECFAIWCMLSLCITPSLEAAAPDVGSQQQIGEFSVQADVGSPVLAGDANYDAANQSYTISGAGTNMWFARDECQFVGKMMKGDFIIQTHAQFPKQGVDPHRKLGVMIRSTLDTDSPHVNASVHGDGLTALQFRRAKGAQTEELKSTVTDADVIQLERTGNRFIMSVARQGELFVKSELDSLELGDEVYVGLFVCSHNPNQIEEAVFTNVRITIPAGKDVVPYRDYLGSRLETLEMASGQRTVVYTTSEGIEAPNWTPDGRQLVYNSRGKMYRFPLDSREPQLIDTGFAIKCNNDHLISADGKLLAISHHAAEADGASLIYTLPIDGGQPQQVTEQGASYLHGWSADDSTMLFTGQRDGEFDIYSIPADGGSEVRLTTAQGLDDGSEYSPDGKHIYFCSTRTGTMQIWRMNSNGNQPVQLTFDDLNDWFPHVSPDGTTIVFVSFAPEIAADQHPYYQHVYLRAMPVGGGEPKVIAYLYGGQGTINVTSWSPDGRRIALVSYTDD